MLIRWKMAERGLPVDNPTNESYHPFSPDQTKPLFSNAPYYYGVLAEFKSGYSDEEIDQARSVLAFFNDQQQILHPDGAGLSLEEMQYVNEEAKQNAPLLGSDVYSKAMEIDCAVRDIQNQQRDFEYLTQAGIVEEISEEDFIDAADAALPAIKEQRVADVNAAYTAIKNSTPNELTFEAKADMLVNKNKHVQAVQNFEFTADDATSIIKELNEFRTRSFNF